MKQDLLKKTSYSIDDLIEIMKMLRAPGGCPWDREQTHQSIRKNFIEETYEAVEAIDTEDPEPLEEELGDVLLQIIFHTEMEEEKGSFSFEDVVTGICRKLIVRHPHVFGDVEVQGSEQVLANWDEIKKRQKGQKKSVETLESVSRALPALMRSTKVQQRAARAGFDWPEVSGALEKIREETAELEEAVAGGSREGIAEELGDLLFSVVNVSRFVKVDAEEALTRATDKFTARFAAVERMAAERGIDMKETSIEELDRLWDEAKSR